MMTPKTTRTVAAAGAFVMALVLTVAPSFALAQSIDIQIDQGWARPAIAGGNGAAYLIITNAGDTPASLIGASSSVANFVEVHETYVIDPADAHADHGDGHGHDHHHDHAHDHHHDHGHEHHHDHHSAGTMLGMRKVDRLEIAPGQVVAFEPGGYHVMLIDLVDGLAWGEEFEVTLHFDGGYSVSATIQVGSEPSR